MSNLIFRLHIPVWVDDNDSFEVDGYSSEDALEQVTGFNKDDERVVWDIDPIEGKVLNWNGNVVHFYDKVRDSGIYELIVDGETIDRVEDYVPDFCCIGDDCYGDYMKFDINESGCIEGWGQEQREGFNTYFHIISADSISSYKDFDQWFKQEQRNIEDSYEDNPQILTPNTVLLATSGEIVKLSDYIKEFINK